MSYSHVSTPVRPFRVMIGGAMVIFGFIGGAFGATYYYHLAMLTDGGPRQINWEMLSGNDMDDHPYVELHGVKIVDPDIFDNEFDANAEKLARFALRAPMHAEIACGPAKIIPKETDADSVPMRIVVPGEAYLLDEAHRQLQDYGYLIGLVTERTEREVMAEYIAGWFDEEIPTADSSIQGALRFVPLAVEPKLGRTRDLFLLCGFAVSLGLILCGSGGPSMWTVFIAPLPSLISLVGYPMRYGRGSRNLRILHVVGGLALMGYAFNLMVSRGNFGQLEANPLLHFCGFTCLFVGLAAVLAVPFQVTTRALVASVEPASRYKPVRLSWEQACSTDSGQKDMDYTDSELMRTNVPPLTGEILEKAEALKAVGFSDPEPMQWQREQGFAAATIQIGCQHMVVSDLEHDPDDDTVECVLISVLGTGIPVITLSANTSITSKNRTTNGVVTWSKSNELNEILSEHLKVLTTASDRQDAVIIDFAGREAEGIVHLARRILAELQGCVGDHPVKVGSKTYGRFHYPPVPFDQRPLDQSTVPYEILSDTTLPPQVPTRTERSVH